MIINAATKTTETIILGTLTSPFELKVTTTKDLINLIFDTLFYIGTPLFILMLIIGGLFYIFSFSSSDLAQKANKILKYGVIGISMVLLSKLIQLLVEILF
jgi:hypothetical protein